MSLLTLIFAGFITGILGSIHCMSMCGGIACSAGYINGSKNRNQNDSENSYEQKITFVNKQPSAFLYSLKFNLGRILSYSLLGALFAYIGHHLINLSDTSTLLSYFRYFSAFLIALIGFKYVIGLQLIDILERGGFRFWSLLKTKFSINKYLSTSSVIPLGMVWGLLPCGLIYTMLISASSAGTAWGGSLVMLAFGLGTLPAMLSISSISKTMKETSNNQWIKTLFGIALIMLSVLLVVLEINSPAHYLCISS